ncbi:MAG: hypothetical protein RL367_159 [Pseudomonadota bacterium]
MIVQNPYPIFSDVQSMELYAAIMIATKGQSGISRGDQACEVP